MREGIDPNPQVEQYARREETLQKPDPNASKEAWVHAMRVAEKNGYKVRTVPAVTRRDREKARLQNYVLSVRTFTMPDTSHIDWTRKGPIMPLDAA